MTDRQVNILLIICIIAAWASLIGWSYVISNSVSTLSDTIDERSTVRAGQIKELQESLGRIEQQLRTSGQPE